VPNTIPIDEETFRWMSKTVSNIILITASGYDKSLIDFSSYLRHSLMNFGVRRLAGGTDNSTTSARLELFETGAPTKETIVTDSFTIMFLKLRSVEWQDTDFSYQN
jgi:hypothetical protein